MSKDLDGIDDPADLDGIEGLDKEKNVVAFDSHKKLLDQKKSIQAKLKESEAELATFKAKEKELADRETKLNEDKLKEQGDWKTIVATREQEVTTLKAEKDELVTKINSFEKKFTDAHKLNAFKEAIGGTLKKDSYFSFVDTSKIALDPATGIIDDKSLKAYANEFVTEYKELIQFKSGAKLPGDAPKHSGSISYEEWTKLAKTDPAEARKRQKDVK